MHTDTLANDLYSEIVKIPLIDPHSHIDPHRPTARSLDDEVSWTLAPMPWGWSG